MQPLGLVAAPGNAALAPKTQPLTLTPNNSSKARAERLLVELGELRVDIENAGIADEHVEPAEGAHGLGDRALVVGEAARHRRRSRSPPRRTRA